MPLRIKIPSGERIIINGAVLENGGDATTFIVHNQADILRRKEILNEKDVTTPARRIYYAIQCAYMFERERERYITSARELIAQYLEAAPSAQEQIDKILSLIDTDVFYQALRETLILIEHETERMQVLHSR